MTEALERYGRAETRPGESELSQSPGSAGVSPAGSAVPRELSEAIVPAGGVRSPEGRALIHNSMAESSHPDDDRFVLLDLSMANWRREVAELQQNFVSHLLDNAIAGTPSTGDGS